MAVISKQLMENFCKTHWIKADVCTMTMIVHLHLGKMKKNSNKEHHLKTRQGHVIFSL